MDIVIGSGSRRQKFVVPSGSVLKALAKSDPIEHVKIVGNVKGLVRAHTKGNKA